MYCVLLYVGKLSSAWTFPPGTQSVFGERGEKERTLYCHGRAIPQSAFELCLWNCKMSDDLLDFPAVEERFQGLNWRLGWGFSAMFGPFSEQRRRVRHPATGTNRDSRLPGISCAYSWGLLLLRIYGS
jgi:hypothetical protein